MEKVETKLKYNIVESQNDGIPVVIVAAGSSNRMCGVNKLFSLIGGIPVIVRTLLAFDTCNEISNIILVVKEDDVFRVQMLTEKYMINKISDIVCGGATRLQSVLKGIARVDKSKDKVLIHDGARPFIDCNIISSVTNSLNKYDAVACGVKIKDTIKRVDKDGKVLKTLDRSEIMAAQTPQGIHIKKFLEAIKSIKDTTLLTDDLSVMEAAGYSTYLVEGSYFNIKVTTPEDLIIAESIKNRGEEK